MAREPVFGREEQDLHILSGSPSPPPSSERHCDLDSASEIGLLIPGTTRANLRQGASAGLELEITLDTPPERGAGGFGFGGQICGRRSPVKGNRID